MRLVGWLLGNEATARPLHSLRIDSISYVDTQATNLREKLERLEALFRELPPEQLLGSEIDLRFGDRMVLRSEAASKAADR